MNALKRQTLLHEVSKVWIRVQHCAFCMHAPHEVSVLVASEKKKGEEMMNGFKSEWSNT